MHRIIPGLNYLLTLVEKKYGRSLRSTSDFESLSIIIENETGELLSSSTLKRLYGYVNLKPVPRKTTLDILCRYLGYRDFAEYARCLKTNNEFSSQFFSSKSIFSDELQAGDCITIGWQPDRVVKLKYLGSDEFVVTESINSQLCIDDRFCQTHFMLSYPLYIARILRNGEYTPAYVAGRQEGLNLLEKE